MTKNISDLLEHLASVDINMDVSAVVDQYEYAVISTQMRRGGGKRSSISIDRFM